MPVTIPQIHLIKLYIRTMTFAKKLQKNIKNACNAYKISLYSHCN